MSRVAESGASYDAYVVVDADSVASANFLSVLNAYLARGDQAIQSYYGVLNREDSWPAALRYVALALFNGLRPRGRDALGLSTGLRGNGMCFAVPIMKRFGWETFTLAEDVEFHFELVGADTRVTYAPAASVLAELPASLAQARSQNVRLERGRLQMLRAHGPRLLREGLRRRDPVRLNAVAEQLVPPLSILTAATALTFMLTAVLRAARSGWRTRCWSGRAPISSPACAWRAWDGAATPPCCGHRSTSPARSASMP